ncbi:hypothetical protein N8944_04670 [Pseudomonadales bacterium]|nr:hypothetical protein [Pseudomonadales bacterium]
MSKVVKAKEKNRLVLELKIGFFVLPIAALLGGIGFGMALAIQAATIPMPWLFVFLIVPTITFIFLIMHYFKKVDYAVENKNH